MFAVRIERSPDDLRMAMAGDRFGAEMMEVGKETFTDRPVRDRESSLVVMARYGANDVIPLAILQTAAGLSGRSLALCTALE